MVLDECPKLTNNRDILVNAINVSTSWAKGAKLNLVTIRKKLYLE